MPAAAEPVAVEATVLLQLTRVKEFLPPEEPIRDVLPTKPDDNPTRLCRRSPLLAQRDLIVNGCAAGGAAARSTHRLPVTGAAKRDVIAQFTSAILYPF
jgi:hypothetical protein